MDVFISPNFKSEKLDNPTIDDVIDVFKDRTMNWLFEPAKKLIEERIGWFSGLCLLLTYFEGIMAYVTGEDSKGKSKKYFRAAFVDVFRSSNISEYQLERVADIMYEDGRCGFFHDGMLRNRIYLSELNKVDMIITLPRKSDGSIDEDGKINSILIDPQKFMAAIEKHFIDYLLGLRNPKETDKRDNFLKMAKGKWDWESEGTVIGLNNDGTL